jgi:hypothetical protein
MPEAAFETTITASERAKTVHASDHSATVTGGTPFIFPQIRNMHYQICNYVWSFSVFPLEIQYELMSHRSVSVLRYIFSQIQNFIKVAKLAL